MNPEARYETALENCLAASQLRDCPPRLVEALNYAVFPGGARVRPRLCLAVAMACGDRHPDLATAASVAIELLHCASLVHDDLPMFDDSDLRRGKPTLHRAFGQPLALLAGDALIVRAFDVVAEVQCTEPALQVRLSRLLCRGVGAPSGIVAGQAWECEDEIRLAQYQQAKTGALFAAATMCGAAAAGADPEPWYQLGATIGAAYQVADDLLDSNGDADQMGKPAGRDAALDRPSAVRELGQQEAARQLRERVNGAANTIPACPGESALRELIRLESEHFMRMALSCREAA